ncbi:MAG: GGDEF domain-containing protein [Rhizobium sp.]
MFNITTGLTIWCSEAVTLAAVLFFAWRHDRKSPAYLAWSIGFVVRAVGLGLVGAHGLLPDFWTIDMGNALTFLGEGAWIAGFCMLDKRKPEWTALLPLAIWMIGVCLPWVNGSWANRVVLYDLASAAGATLLAAAVRPAIGRREAARRPLALLLMLLACVCFSLALAMVILRPSDDAALVYRTISAVAKALLTTVAIVLAGHVLLQRSQRRWQVLSLTDSLTSVLNRRGLQEFFTLLLRETTDPTKRIAALLFDLDHFKGINDHYGHHTGDLVLCEFVRTAKNFLPRHAGFGRMGGEEFMAFVAVTDQTEAEALAEIIRAAFCRMPFNIDTRPVSATVSIGVALATPAAADWDRLNAAADQALYAAKAAGRNCTIIFGEHETARASDTPPSLQAGELVPTVDDQVQALQRLGALARS